MNDVKLESCDKKKDEAFTCEKIGAEVTKDCNILIKGCCTVKKKFDTMSVSMIFVSVNVSEPGGVVVEPWTPMQEDE